MKKVTIPEKDYRNYVMETERVFDELLNRVSSIRFYSNGNFSDLSSLETVLSNGYNSFCRKIVDPLVK